MCMIRRELDVPIDSETFWTDSTTVLKYLRNETRRFQVFVANRVQAIRDETVPTQWRFVNSKCNPADDASCGLKGCELSTQQRWIRGPDFLRLPESEWPALPPDLEEIVLVVVSGLPLCLFFMYLGLIRRPMATELSQSLPRDCGMLCPFR